MRCLSSEQARGRGGRTGRSDGSDQEEDRDARQARVGTRGVWLWSMGIPARERRGGFGSLVGRRVRHGLARGGNARFGGAETEGLP